MVSVLPRTWRPFNWDNPTHYISAQKLIGKAVCYINGKWVEASGGTIAVEDPCTNDCIGHVPRFGHAETTDAIAAAEKAFQTWKDVMPRQRARMLLKWADIMRENKKGLGIILSRESGKVLAEGVSEVLYAQSFVDWYAGEAERVYGDIILGPRPNVQTTVIKQPIGVVGIITPWNFPAAMITRAAAGAIAAGCTVVVKPASATPFTALALAQAAEEAGFPAGVLNVVTGDSSEVGKAMLDSSVVRKIAFTGSTNVGKSLYRECADTVKKVSMELGGNAPFIVFDDADLTRAAEGLIAAKFRNAGQTCICCNRVLVQSAIYERFKKMVVERVATLKVGSNFDASVQIGALINKSAVTHMKAMVEDAIAKGATLEVGGHPIGGKGYFFEPTVLSDTNHQTNRCCQEELFGPILPLVKFESEEEAIDLANSTRAGLASYVYTSDYRRQHRVATALQFGMVGVNDSTLSAACAPFGGVKESGLGRDGSKYGIEQFVNIKYVLFSTV